MPPRRTRATQSERCHSAIGAWWQASSRNARPDESWYWEYWYEKEHSPDLAIVIARRLRSLFRRLIGGLRWSLTVVKTGDVSDARSTEVGRRWDTNGMPSKPLSAAYSDQDGNSKIALASMVQHRSQTDDAAAWHGIDMI